MAGTGRSAPFTPTHVGVRFGPDERDLMAVWLAESADPAPAVLCFHPGRVRKLARPGPVRTAPPVVRRDILALVEAGISIVAPSHHGAGRTPFEGAAHSRPSGSSGVAESTSSGGGSRVNRIRRSNRESAWPLTQGSVA